MKPSKKCYKRVQASGNPCTICTELLMGLLTTAAVLTGVFMFMSILG